MKERIEIVDFQKEAKRRQRKEKVLTKINSIDSRTSGTWNNHGWNKSSE